MEVLSLPKCQKCCSVKSLNLAMILYVLDSPSKALRYFPKLGQKTQSQIFFCFFVWNVESLNIF